MTEIRLPLRAIGPFATGSIGMGIWVTVPGILLLYFLTDVLAVPPAAAGLALLVPNIADIVLHPWIGRISDTDRAATGHRRRLMLAGCAVVLTFVALFAVPSGLHGTPAAIWVAAALVTGNLLYSAYQVPYLATPADLGIGYHERTRLMGFRNTVITIGVLLSGVVAPLITGDAPDVGDYGRMAVILGAAMLAAMLTGITGVARLNRAAPAAVTSPVPVVPVVPPVPVTSPVPVVPVVPPVPVTSPVPVVPSAAVASPVPGVPVVPSAAVASPVPVGPSAAQHRGGLLAALRDRHFRVLTASYLTMAITMNLVLAALPYFAKYELGRPGLTPALVALFMGPAVLTTPLWVLAARRLGKQRCLLVAQAGFVAGSLVLAAGAAAGLPVLIGAMAVLGVSFAAMQLMPLSMVPDVIAASGPGGTARAGAYTGLWTAAEATGGAVGPYVFSAVLLLGGFVASAAGEQVTQSPAALDAVRYGFTLVPAALMTVAVLLQRRYTLDRTVSEPAAKATA